VKKLNPGRRRHPAASWPAGVGKTSLGPSIARAIGRQQYVTVQCTSFSYVLLEQRVQDDFVVGVLQRFGERSDGFGATRESEREGHRAAMPRASELRIGQHGVIVLNDVVADQRFEARDLRPFLTLGRPHH
jgi:hypothetical protein